tara:strand:- start:384 stop:545 length:162 start_codon:yes stop_codon:yes gene_type:complete
MTEIETNNRLVITEKQIESIMSDAYKAAKLEKKRVKNERSQSRSKDIRQGHRQ